MSHFSINISCIESFGSLSRLSIVLTISCLLSSEIPIESKTSSIIKRLLIFKIQDHFGGLNHSINEIARSNISTSA